MCGISGIMKLNQRTVAFGESTLLEVGKAIEVQKHRGPDDTGVCGLSFEDSKIDNVATVDDLIRRNRKYDVIFGFNRLSIKDLSIEGHQPMQSTDGNVVLVFNGEIYNDKQLRNELEKRNRVSFRSTSDTEVILQMYLNYGIDVTLEKLNGMFAFAIADLRCGKIFLARDRMGIKPLYYYTDSNIMTFASEVKSLIQFSHVSKEIDIDAYNARLIFSRPSKEVLLKNVELVEPGQLVTIHFDRGITKEKFFDINKYERVSGKYNNLQEVLEIADATLQDAVSRQMISDVKLGCQLSGGIDSSLVTYYANKMGHGGFEDVVSICYGESGKGEELYIDRVGTDLDLKVHKFIMEEKYFVENYETMIWHNDAPVYKPFFAAFKRLAMGATEHVTVLLSGEGADEIAGGYNRFATGVFQPFISSICDDRGKIRGYNSYSDYAVMTDSTIDEFTTLGYTEIEKLLEEQKSIFDGFDGSNLTKHLKYEITQRLPESLLRQDKMTMAHSIENRVPLLDNEIVDLIMQLPEEYLLRFTDISPTKLSNDPMSWIQGKYVFKELLATKFGRDFVYRKKQTMNESINERQLLSSKEFKDYFYSVTLPGMKKRGLVDYSVIKDSFDNVENISIKKFNSMWRAIGLETWTELFIDR